MVCLSNARHEYIKVNFDSTVVIDKGEDTTAGNRQWITQSEYVYDISRFKRDKRLGDLVYWDVL